MTTQNPETSSLRQQFLDHLESVRQAGQVPDLSNANLAGADLHQANLAQVNLRAANLRGADLRAADLRGADLEEADLSEARLHQADLRAARLKRTRLKDADLSEANLAEVDLSAALTSGARFTQAILEKTALRSHWLQKNDFRLANLRGADLRDVQGETNDFSLADLSSANLANARLPRTSFAGARLNGAELRKVRLEYANLRQADLSSADLSNADLSHADLTEANLSGADLRGANLRTEAAGAAIFKDAISDERTVWPPAHDPQALAEANRLTLNLRWEASAPAEQEPFTGPEELDALALSPDQQRIVGLAQQARQVMVFDYATGKRQQTLNLQTGSDTLAGLAITADNHFALLAVNGAGCSLRYVALEESALAPAGLANPTPPEIAWVKSISMAPNGRFVLLSNHASIEVYDHLNMRPAYFLRMQGLASESDESRFLVQPVRISADSKRALAAAGSTLAVWDIPSRDLLRQVDTGAPITALALLPQADVALLGHADGNLSAWNWQNGQRLNLALSSPQHHGPVSALAVTPNGRWLLSGGAEDANIYILDASTLGAASAPTTTRRKRCLAGHTQGIAHLLACADSQHVLSGGLDGSIRRWHISSGRLATHSLPRTPASSPAIIDPRGRLAVTPYGREARTLGVRSLESGRLRHVLRGHQGDIHALAFLDDGRHLFSTAADHLLLLWDLEEGKLDHALAGQHAAGLGLHVRREQNQALTACSDGRILAWDLRTSKASLVGPGSKSKTAGGRPTAAVFSPDGRYVLEHRPNLADAANERPYSLIDLQSKQEIMRLPAWQPGWQLSAEVFSPSGRLLAWLGLEGGLGLFDLARRAALPLESGENIRYGLAAFSPDERWLAALRLPDQIAVFDLSSGEQVGGYSGHLARPCALTFHPNNLWAFSGDASGSLRLWELPGGREAAALALEHAIERLVVSPDGSAVLACGPEGKVSCIEIQER